MKKKVILIGRGKWGKILKKKLDELSILVSVCGKNFKKEKYDKIDWAFIATPDKTHKEIIEFLIEKKIKIFCEKPLVRNYNEAKSLISLINKKEKKIYISDLLSFAKKKIPILKKNKIVRSKNANYNQREILYRLVYHDIYYIFKYLKNKQIKVSKSYSKKKLYINLKTKNYEFNMYYNLDSNHKTHTFNDKKISFKNEDPLKLMIKKVLNEKVNFNKNNKKNIFVLKILNKILCTN